ncbi:MAG: hypothetical protein ACOY5W_17240 [Pseudomonadota bacterium]
MASMHPPLEPLRLVLERLRQGGVQAALGGSGLLFAHGLVERVNDWDLTTDAPPEQIRPAILPLDWEDRTGGQDYATAGRFVIRQDGIEIDVMSRFAIATEGGVCRLPTLVAGTWQGVECGSLEVWAAAYWLMGRTPKAERTLAHLRRHGASPERLERILQEPLPASLRVALESLR